MRLDPKKLMVGRKLHSGFHRHEGPHGGNAFSVEIVEAATGFLVYFEAVTSQTKAFARATELTGCFADCDFIGQITGTPDAD